MISLPVLESSQVGAARRRALQEAQALGVPEEDADRLAIIVTEIATNLLRHAREGEIVLVPEHADGRRRVSVVGLDLGPGIGNIEAAFEDGFTTAGEEDSGIGGGLGAIRRMSDRFDVYTDQKGTTIVSTVSSGGWREPVGAEVDGVIVPKPGFDAGGDAFAVRRAGASTLVMLVDVLGHGAAAAADARLAVESFEAETAESIEDTHETVAQALEGRRGAAALIVRLTEGASQLEAIGLGNVRGEIIMPDGERRGIPCAPGIVGARGRSPRPTEHDWNGEATLVLSTDGLRAGDRAPEPPALFQRDALTVAATIYKRRRRGSDDSGVVVARWRP